MTGSEVAKPVLLLLLQLQFFWDVMSHKLGNRTNDVKDHNAFVSRVKQSKSDHITL
jgi:hypothetical protein